MPENKKTIRILSIDGGGIRGIIPGTILQYLEEQIRKQTGNGKAKISDYFDLMAGTSTGGILSLALLCPDSKGKAKYSAEQAVGFYIDRGGEIFSVSSWEKFKSLGGVIDEKFPADNLEQAFKDYFGKVKLSELIKPCLITSYDIKSRKEIFFNQSDIKNKKDDYYITDVARATSAAPTFFETANIHSIDGTANPMIDGGIFANNPAMCAFVEATKFKPIPALSDIMIVSIGTGNDKKNLQSFTYEKAKNWGMAGWVKPLIDIMMSASSETVNYQLQVLFKNIDCPNNYFRIQPDLETADGDMSNASNRNIKALINDAKKYISENQIQLDAVIKAIIQ